MMAKTYQLAVYNIAGERLCVLYDSRYAQDGAADNFEIKKDRSGWKELSFTLPWRMNDGEKNYRLDYIRNENLLYLYENDVCDVYIIKEDNDTHSSKAIEFKVQGNHIQEELKARNLYKYFDDENGIGTCDALLRKALGGSGWTLGDCPVFYEADGTTEKVRSYSCETKTGAYKMIQDICELFKARPVFHGYERVVDIVAREDTEGYRELNYGKNLSKVARKLDSSNLVTRLYVEGEYGDFGYVGIDDAEGNETGLPFILNFDYFRELGLFTAEHEAALADYIDDYGTVTRNIADGTAELLEDSASLIALIGVCEYALFPIVNGAVDTNNAVFSPGASDALKALNTGDAAIFIQSSGRYIHDEYGTPSLSSYSYIAKFDPTITGLMAAHEDLISVSGDALDAHLEKANEFWSEQDESWEDISLEDFLEEWEDYKENPTEDSIFHFDTAQQYAEAIEQIDSIHNDAQEELDDETLEMIDLMESIDVLSKNIAQWQEDQADADEAFAVAMGTMLRDGYWSDDNYAPGQEDSLYQDALAISQKLAWPVATYSVDYQTMEIVEGYEDEQVLLSMLVRLYDPDLPMNERAYIEETKEYPTNPTKNSIEITTDLLNLANKSFSTMIERITDLADEVKNNRDIYKRAASISREGKFNSSLLEGAIDTLTTRLMSTSSNWSTDDKGNIMFISLDGSSAMMLSGNGFMIANSKKADGSWNWRTFGTGEGFTADMIVAGFLSAERIMAGSITTNKLASDVGASLDISSNTAISLLVDSTQLKITPTSILTAVTNAADGDSSQPASQTTREQFAHLVETTVTSGSAFSQVSQTANKILWLVGNSASQASLTLTDEAIEAVGNKISLIGEEISLVVADGLNDTSFDVLSGAIIGTVTNSDQYIAMDGRVDDLEGVTNTQSAQLSLLADGLELTVKQADLEGYIRNDIYGVHVGRSDSLFEATVKAEGFQVDYYENGREAGNPKLVWQATAYGMRSTQITLDIGLNDTLSGQIVQQIGTATGGMAWV